MLRVLVVEDTRERQDILTSLYRDHAWILVHTVARARRLLDVYDFDVVSLDYNLAGPGDGCDVARHLIASRNVAARVVVHSMNPRGRERLLGIVPDPVVMPVDRIVRSNRELRRLRAALVVGRHFDWS
jgi:DNA-binding response OmpR family regulator